MINEIINATNDDIISLLDDIISSLHLKGPTDPSSFEILALIKLFHPEIFRERESEILYLSGLFYKVEAPRNLIEEAYSIFADTIEQDTGRRFTPVQADAYKNIRDKQFFSFSAPTSAGKSFLFRELITNETGDIVIVVPSRALIAEYLNAVKKLVDKSVLVLQFVDNINTEHINRRVFIITPERGGDLFRYQSEFNIRLVLFDEAQLSEAEIRGIGFDAFVRRVAFVFPNATKVFAHPFVKNPEAQLQKHGFSECSSASAYDQLAVGKVFITIDQTDQFYFSPYHNNGNERVPVIKDHVKEILRHNGTVLIYASKTKLYSGEYLKEYRHYLRYCPKLTDATALSYIERLREYIGASKTLSRKKSLLVELMKRGIVMHHGSMPLKMRLLIEAFVRDGFARICFATATLNQGINMPFDAVYIDNYSRMDVLTLKNLIGRAGRSTSTKNCFEFGYTFINKRNVPSFCQRINVMYQLTAKSALDADVSAVDEDNADLVEAIKTDTFDSETRLTHSQLERLRSSNIDQNVEFILDNLLIGDRALTGNEYYELLNDAERMRIKDAFKALYLTHLRREELTSVEQAILSTAIPILLWQIQGKTFKEILALRYSYLTRLSEQRKINSLARKGEISDEDRDKRIQQLKLRFSQGPSTLPNKNARSYCDFGRDKSILELDYDTLVFDTYDYIDKVISLSLSDPLCAAFMLYYQKTGDSRALSMVNYIRYGTNNPKEIWLLRYGFAFEDIAWIAPLVVQIDEKGIEFDSAIDGITPDRKEIVERYM